MSEKLNIARIYTSPDYLGEADLNDREVTVQITGAELVSDLKASPGDQPKPRIVLTLASASGRKLGKRLILNKTNFRTLHKGIKSKYAEDWLGRWIRLIPSTCAAFGVSDTPCIRVAVAEAPAPKAAPASDTETTTESSS